MPDATAPSPVDRAQIARSVAVTTLMVLAVLYTLFFARALILPVVLALLLSLLLTPIVRFFHRKLHVPPAVGAGVVLLSLLASIGLSVVFAVQPAADWIQDLPSRVPDIQHRLNALRAPFERFSEASEQVQDITSFDEEESTPAVTVEDEGALSGILMYRTPAFLANIVVMFILLYFLLASGDQFLRKIVRIVPRFQDKRRAVEIANDIEKRIASYLQTITIINLALGGCLSLAAWLIGLPNAPLWGILAFLLNFIPYLGPLLGTAFAFIISLLTFESIGHALALPAVYIALNIVEGNFITPLILSRILTLNTVIVFLSIMFWTWLWGIPGALLAVPILATLKIVSDHIDFLRPVGEFIGDESSSEKSS